MTAPIRDSDHRRLDGKINALLVVTGINLILLILAWVGIIDLAT